MTQQFHYGNMSEESQNTNSKEYMDLFVIEVLFIIAKIWKQTKCPSVGEWIKQLWYIYTMGYYSDKKIYFFTLCDSMNGPGENYAK